MRKIICYSFLLAFLSVNIFGSCNNITDENIESKRFFSKYEIYDRKDSVRTGITVYVGVVDGHKYRYHLFNGKNKSQMEVEHIFDECKECKKISKK